MVFFETPGWEQPHPRSTAGDQQSKPRPHMWTVNMFILSFTITDKVQFVSPQDGHTHTHANTHEPRLLIRGSGEQWLRRK